MRLYQVSSQAFRQLHPLPSIATGPRHSFEIIQHLDLALCLTIHCIGSSTLVENEGQAYMNDGRNKGNGFPEDAYVSRILSLLLVTRAAVHTLPNRFRAILRSRTDTTLSFCASGPEGTEHWTRVTGLNS